MKELHAGNLYWPTTFPNPTQYPPLSQNTNVQVAIVGGGMSGILCAHEFVSSGLHTALVERKEIADGSTSANTGLLQYSNDIMLSELIKQIGRNQAELFYRSCAQAVEDIAALTEQFQIDVGFRRRSSLYYASSEQDLPKVKQEYEALRHCGLNAEYWSDEEIMHHFPFRKPGAVVTHGDAEVNPYQCIQATASEAVKKGLRIYEHTNIVKHERLTNGRHRLHSADGYVLEAEHLVYAVGYEPEELRGKLIRAQLNRSYVITTESQADFSAWHDKFLIWESARPYLYLRTTLDGRVIVGGLDEELEKPVHNKHKRQHQSELLHKQLQALFPMLTAPIAFEWNGTFGESKDGLPFIGQDPEWSNVYYTLGYGGNGTVYSMIASQLLRNLIMGKTHPLTDIVRLDR